MLQNKWMVLFVLGAHVVMTSAYIDEYHTTGTKLDVNSQNELVTVNEPDDGQEDVKNMRGLLNQILAMVTKNSARIEQIPQLVSREISIAAKVNNIAETSHFFREGSAGKLLVFVHKAKSWEEANKHCIRNGAYLAQPEDQKVLTDMLFEHSGIMKCHSSRMGKEYMGHVAVTKSGLECQRWDKQTPHKHSRNNTNSFPDATLKDASNYCRNPDNEPLGLWCYTVESGVRWKYCDVPKCTGFSSSNTYWTDDVTKTKPADENHCGVLSRTSGDKRHELGSQSCASSHHFICEQDLSQLDSLSATWRVLARKI